MYIVYYAVIACLQYTENLIYACIEPYLELYVKNKNGAISVILCA